MVSPAEFQKNIGIEFSDLSLLEKALTHSSFVNENPGPSVESNERLEFLGDAVLGQVVAERLFIEFPGLSEGEMTRLRSVLVRGETLARVARSLGLGEGLFLGKGEDANGGRDKPANLAGAMEAVIAAVYLDRGAETVRDFIMRLPARAAAWTTSRGYRS